MYYLSAVKNDLLYLKKGALKREFTTTGSVNVYDVHFEFDSAWDGLDRFAVFKCGSEKPINQALDETNTCKIPWEVMTQDKKGRPLFAGVYGTKDGTVVLPTIWVSLGSNQEGCEPGEIAQDKTPDLLDQLLAQTFENRNAAAQSAEAAKDAQAAAEKAAETAEENATKTIAAAKDAEASAADAASSEARAKQYAGEAAESAENAAQSETAALNAKRIAESSIASSAESARQAADSATAAKQSAEDAEVSAEQAAASAEAAANSANVLLYVTINIDEDTGALVLYVPEGYNGPEFVLDEDTGLLSVLIPKGA